jgi:hypothetical protein
MKQSELFRTIKQAINVNTSLYRRLIINTTSFGWSITIQCAHDTVSTSHILASIEKRNAFPDHHVTATRKGENISVKLYSRESYSSAPVVQEVKTTDTGSTDRQVNRRHYRKLVQSILNLDTAQFAMVDAFESKDNSWTVAYYNIKRVNLDQVVAKLDDSHLATRYQISTRPGQLQPNTTTMWVRVYSSPITQPKVIQNALIAATESTTKAACTSNKTCGVANKQKVSVDYEQLVAAFASSVKSGAINKSAITKNADTVYNMMAGDLSLSEISDVAKLIGKPVTVTIS